MQLQHEAAVGERHIVTVARRKARPRREHAPPTDLDHQRAGAIEIDYRLHRHVQVGHRAGGGISVERLGERQPLERQERQPRGLRRIEDRPSGVKQRQIARQILHVRLARGAIARQVAERLQLTTVADLLGQCVEQLSERQRTATGGWRARREWS